MQRGTWNAWLRPFARSFVYTYEQSKGSPMTTHTSDQVKDSVRERYAAIARSGESCCAPADAGDDCCSPTAVQFTSKAHATSVVAESDLGLSCGSPTVYGDIHPGDTVLDLEWGRRRRVPGGRARW